MNKICDYLKMLIMLVIVFGVVCTIWWHVGTQDIFLHGGKRFDSLTALFTGLAFAGVIATLFFQTIQFNKSLELQCKVALANQNSAKIAEKNLRIEFLRYWLKEKESTMHRATENMLNGHTILVELMTDHGIKSLQDFKKFDHKTITLKKDGGVITLPPDSPEFEYVYTLMESLEFCTLYNQMMQELNALATPEGAEAPPASS